jgi:DNA-binding CsgD family transcriptional regulator
MVMTYDQLRRERDGFRDLVVQLSTILLTNVVEQKRLPKLSSGETSTQPSQAVSLTEIAPRLREAAIRYAHLSRERPDNPIGQEFETLSVELADVAERLETLIAGDAGRPRTTQLHPRPAITDREREVLAWAAQGKSSWEIGQILLISEKAANKYAQTVFQKLGAVNKTHAVAIALREGFI